MVQILAVIASAIALSAAYPVGSPTSPLAKRVPQMYPAYDPGHMSPFDHRFLPASPEEHKEYPTPVFPRLPPLKLAWKPGNEGDDFIPGHAVEESAWPFDHPYPSRLPLFFGQPPYPTMAWGPCGTNVSRNSITGEVKRQVDWPHAPYPTGAFAPHATNVARSATTHVANGEVDSAHAAPKSVPNAPVARSIHAHHAPPVLMSECEKEVWKWRTERPHTAPPACMQHEQPPFQTASDDFAYPEIKTPEECDEAISKWRMERPHTPMPRCTPTVVEAPRLPKEDESIWEWQVMSPHTAIPGSDE